MKIALICPLYDERWHCLDFLLPFHKDNKGLTQLFGVEGWGKGDFPEPSPEGWQPPDVEVTYDIGINMLGTQKIPEKHLFVDKDGKKGHRWLNFHPAPLPEYRGRNVAYHAIMNGEKEFGATLHYMDESYDTGPIVEVSRFPVEPGDTAGDLFRKSREHCLSLFRKWIPRLIEEGSLPSKEQGEGEGHYYKKEAIDDVIWSAPLSDYQTSFEKKIRALTVHPKHHAKIVIGGRTYKIVPE